MRSHLGQGKHLRLHVQLPLVHEVVPAEGGVKVVLEVSGGLVSTHLLLRFQLHVVASLHAGCDPAQHILVEVVEGACSTEFSFFLCLLLGHFGMIYLKFFNSIGGQKECK